MVERPTLDGSATWRRASPLISGTVVNSPTGEVRALVAHIGKRQHRSNTKRAGASACSTLRQAEPPVLPLFHDGGEDFRSQAVGGVKVNRG